MVYYSPINDGKSAFFRKVLGRIDGEENFGIFARADFVNVFQPDPSLIRVFFARFPPQFPLFLVQPVETSVNAARRSDFYQLSALKHGI